MRIIIKEFRSPVFIFFCEIFSLSRKFSYFDNLIDPWVNNYRWFIFVSVFKKNLNLFRSFFV